MFNEQKVYEFIDFYTNNKAKDLENSADGLEFHIVCYKEIKFIYWSS